MLPAALDPRAVLGRKGEGKVGGAYGGMATLVYARVVRRCALGRLTALLAFDGGKAGKSAEHQKKRCRKRNRSNGYNILS